MSVLDLQKRARRLGEIRLGDTVTKDGKTRPVALETFRLTSINRHYLERAAELWGGSVIGWEPRPGASPKWQVVTNATELPVFVPPQDPDGVTWYEHWGQGGMQRRCDGENIVGREGTLPCVCDPSNRQCSLVTRLQVMLPDLPDVGVWLLSSTGYFAATELSMPIKIVMDQMAETGTLPQATLAIEPREIKRQGEPTKKFVVPVLRFADALSTFLDPSSIPQGLGSGSAALTSGGDHSSDEDAGAGVDPSAPVPAPSLPDEVVEAEVEPDDEEEWSTLLALLEETPDEGTMGTVDTRIRSLFKLMDAVGLWPNEEHTRHTTVQKHFGTIHLSDLRKQQLNEFAVSAFDAAKGKVAAQ